ncbi:hypothetical protein C8R44DRAFT_852276 [Mycena epipterygia]|nr:hypothetical protein C8R44DRAFT_852276 [Mycena epipterygia]
MPVDFDVGIRHRKLLDTNEGPLDLDIFFVKSHLSKPDLRLVELRPPTTCMPLSSVHRFWLRKWPLIPLLLQAIIDFPPELLAKIFLKLSYTSLLSVMTVSAQWHAIVREDPALAVQMFKRPSTLHPAVQIASYVMGEPLDCVYFYNDRELSSLAIANDFFSIPAVMLVTIVIPRRVGSPCGLKLNVKNAKGVKLVDMFAALERVLIKPSSYCDALQETLTKAALLGDHVHYEGLSNLQLVSGNGTHQQEQNVATPPSIRMLSHNRSSVELAPKTPYRTDAVYDKLGSQQTHPRRVSG